MAKAEQPKQIMNDTPRELETLIEQELREYWNHATDCASVRGFGDCDCLEEVGSDRDRITRIARAAFALGQERERERHADLVKHAHAMLRIWEDDELDATYEVFRDVLQRLLLRFLRPQEPPYERDSRR